MFKEVVCCDVVLSGKPVKSFKRNLLEKGKVYFLFYNIAKRHKKDRCGLEN